MSYKRLKVFSRPAGEGLFLLIREHFPEAEIEFMGKRKLFPLGIRSFVKSLFLWKLWSLPVKLVKSADAFVLGGGGLFTDEERYFVGAFWALQGLLASLFCKKILICGVSIGEMGVVSTFFTKKLFKKATIVIVRDTPSYEIFKKWNIKAELGIDLALFLKSKFENIRKIEKSSHDDKEKYFILCLKAFKNYDDKLITIFTQFIDFLSSKYDFNITLLCLQSTALNDVYILNKIIDQYRIQYGNSKNIKIEKYDGNIYEIVELISGAEAVISMRLHGSILSLITRTPFLPIAYMSKVSDFFSDFPGLNFLKLNELNLTRLKEISDSFLSDRNKAKQNIDNYLVSIEEKRLLTEKIMIDTLTR